MWRRPTSGSREPGAAPTLARRPLLALLALGGCAPVLPPLAGAGGDRAAFELLRLSAARHGQDALADIADLAVAYAGTWPPLIDRLQPALVDAGFRGGSEERLLLGPRIVGQAHAGPEGSKQVLRRPRDGTPGEVRVWRDGVEIADAEQRAAAALVADGYRLFLLGPMLLARRDAAVLEVTGGLAGSREIAVGGERLLCDVVQLRIAPGLGFAAADDLALFIAREGRLMRRVRFTLNGLELTRGAVAEVDCADHLLLHGVRWPTRFRERLLRPLPLRVHDWRLIGLDVNRGLAPADLEGAAWTARAAARAGSLAPGPAPAAATARLSPPLGPSEDGGAE